MCINSFKYQKKHEIGFETLKKSLMKSILTGFIFVVGVGGVTPIIAQTDVAPCYQVSEPILGTRCYQRVSVESRHVAYGEGISRGESSSTSPW